MNYTALLLFIFVIAVVVILSSIFHKEKFITHDNYPGTGMISHGSIRKTPVSDGFLYEYFYNLPNPFSEFQVVVPGVAFNEKVDKMEYIVSAGSDKENLKYIGKLQRRNDGYHVLTIRSKEDYKVSCISLKDKIISCVYF